MPPSKTALRDRSSSSTEKNAGRGGSWVTSTHREPHRGQPIPHATASTTSQSPHTSHVTSPVIRASVADRLLFQLAFLGGDERGGQRLDRVVDRVVVHQVAADQGFDRRQDGFRGFDDALSEFV